MAPRSYNYCQSSCEEYCAQTDRRDGLSGSVDSSAAEVGLASAYDLGAKVSGTAPVGVPYGEDKLPSLGLPDAVQRALGDAVRGGSGSPPG